eukprot:TRINITY_DN68031_c2_g2_i1.p1 TRINITY_DN68031_c2_g2~~TRINITY_DN68031_c2_g2_i1.p1  ORF type:complete len:680 (+),score=104.56 TRINITY_DN68031_c2_g2_i1:44-2083(+)
MNRGTKPKCCENCKTTGTAQWRTGPSGEKLCNKCGLYLQRHSKPRPLDLQSSQSTNTSFKVLAKQVEFQLDHKYEDRVKREERFLDAQHGARPEGKITNTRRRQLELALQHQQQRQEEMRQYYERLSGVSPLALENFENVQRLTQTFAALSEQQAQQQQQQQPQPAHNVTHYPPIQPAPAPTAPPVKAGPPELNAGLHTQLKLVQDQLREIQMVLHQQAQEREGTSTVSSPVESNQTEEDSFDDNLRPRDVLLLQQQSRLQTQLQSQLNSLEHMLSPATMTNTTAMETASLASEMSDTLPPTPLSTGTSADDNSRRGSCLIDTNSFPFAHHLRAKEGQTIDTLADLVLRWRAGNPASNVLSRQTELRLQEIPQKQREEAKYQDATARAHALPMQAYEKFLADGGGVCPPAAATRSINPPAFTPAHRKRPRSQMTSSPPRDGSSPDTTTTTTTTTSATHSAAIKTEQQNQTYCLPELASATSDVAVVGAPPRPQQQQKPNPSAADIAAALSSLGVQQPNKYSLDDTNTLLALLTQSLLPQQQPRPCPAPTPTTDYGTNSFLSGNLQDGGAMEQSPSSSPRISAEIPPASCYGGDGLTPLLVDSPNDKCVPADDSFRFWDDANHNLCNPGALQEPTSNNSQMSFTKALEDCNMEVDAGGYVGGSAFDLIDLSDPFPQDVVM